MSKLILKRKNSLGLKLPIPFFVSVNDKIIGGTRNDMVQIEMPKGSYKLGVQYIFPLWKWNFTLSSDMNFSIDDNETAEYEFFHKEIIWDILFDIDLLFWLAEFFIELPHPWNIVYKVCSNGFFIIWLLRLVLIRKRYFTFKKISDDNSRS